MPGEAVFLDTSGWITLLNASDPLHAQAWDVWRGVVTGARPVVLTDLVVAETGNGLARTRLRAHFVAAVELIYESRTTELIHTGSDELRDALSLYVARPHKAWGLVDCVSFRLTEQRGIPDAFTTDRHFEQAGFRCLLPTA
jgi:predicted nucleic acid-binding protein